MFDRRIRNVWRDGFRFIRNLTPYRILNIIGVILGCLASNLTKKLFIWGKPYSLSMEPTNYCNLNCLECPSGNGDLGRNRGFMDMEMYQKIIDEVADHLVWLMIYFQGEPFLHRDLAAMIRYANQKKMYTCISTNGHFLSPRNCKDIIHSGTDRLIVSMEGADQRTYEKYRKSGDLQKVKEGLENLSREKKKQGAKTPFIVIQSLVFKHNQHQLDDIKELADHLGADQISFKSAQIYNYKYKAQLIPDNPKHSRYTINSDGDLQLKNRLRNRCFRIWNSCVITFDGQMLPCCFDKKGKYPVADLSEQNFAQGWKSQAFNDFRKQILQNRHAVDICRNCTGN